MNLVRAALASIIATCLWAGAALAQQDYPNRPVTLIVAFPPGGADDATARILQDPLQRALGQPIVIENVAGAGGTLAAAKAAKATPDGYTILLHQNSLAAAMTLYPKRTFEAENFVPIGLVNTAAGVLAGRGDLPPNNFDELLKWIKTPGLIIKFGHPGVGSWGHLAGVLITQELGMTVTQIPYRGAGPALIDLLGGQMDLSVQSAIADSALIRDKKLKGYAIVGMKQFAGLPGLKTLGELGYKKLKFDFWHGLFAPAGTPRPIIDKLNAALRTAMGDERLLKTYAEGGMDRYPPEEMSPEAAGALLKKEVVLWGEVIRTNNISTQ
jgi:tripartite-type tricarboxylate transporter receptor subunit TctC